jgi:hypothetical protein
MGSDKCEDFPDTGEESMGERKGKQTKGKMKRNPCQRLQTPQQEPSISLGPAREMNVRLSHPLFSPLITLKSFLGVYRSPIQCNFPLLVQNTLLPCHCLKVRFRQTNILCLRSNSCNLPCFDDLVNWSRAEGETAVSVRGSRFKNGRDSMRQLKKRTFNSWDKLIQKGQSP